MRRRSAVLGCLLAAVVPRAAVADLKGEAATVRAGLESDGALVAAVPPAFLEAGDVKVVEPLTLVSSQDACVTVVVIAERSISFDVVRGSLAEKPTEALTHARTDKDPRREEGSQGLYAHTFCRDETRTVERLLVRMRSPRGSVEMLVARSPAPPPSIAALEVSREPGPGAPLGDPGQPMTSLPFEFRKKRSDAREKQAGAASLATVSMRASEVGAGEFDLRVSAGCHAFDVFGGATSGADVDAELRASASGEMLAQDRGEAPDAHLETCVPEVTRVALRFAGAGPSNDVSVTDALFSWPRWIDERWGPRVAATWANLTRRRVTPSPESEPIAEVLGGQGSAVSWIPVEPGACYLAMVGLTRGRARGLRLAASASARPSMEESSAPSDGAEIVFCSEDRDEARVRVDAPNASNWWVLSVWRLGEAAHGSDP